MSDQPHLPLNPSQPDWDALARHVSGEGTAGERVQQQRAIDEQPGRAALVVLLAEAGRVQDPPAPTSAETEAALAQVRVRAAQDARVASAPRRSAVVSLDGYRSRWRHARIAAAAAVIVVAGASVLWRSSVQRAPANVAPTTYATAAGAIDSVMLPDGSRVLLGPGSHLELARGFSPNLRDVTLTGEARFTVVHDQAHPLTIHTASAIVRDVGTVFSVHSDDVEGVRVVVTEGSVDVQERSGATHQTLAAGDVGIVATDGGIQVQRSGVGADDLAWTQGRLVFRDASVAQVTADLRRWYGVDLKVDAALARRPVTASFDRGLSAADVTKIVAATIGGALRDEAGVLRIVPVSAGSSVK